MTTGTSSAAKAAAIERAQYLEIPVTAPNGTVTGVHPVKIKTIEEVRIAGSPGSPLGAAGAGSPSGDLAAAAEKLFRAIAAKIAFHEKEAQRLREVAGLYSNLARQSVAEQTHDGGDLDALYRLVDQVVADRLTAPSGEP